MAAVSHSMPIKYVPMLITVHMLVMKFWLMQIYSEKMICIKTNTKSFILC